MKRWTLIFVTFLLAALAPQGYSQAQKPDQAPQREAPAHEPTAADLSRSETLASAMMRTFDFQEYEFRSAAEAMPAEKFDFRPVQGLFAKEKPEFGPSEVRTFAEQVKHVACANFAFSAELDGKAPPPGCDKSEPASVKTRPEILSYLRDSFVALKKSLNAINDKNRFDTPSKGPTLDQTRAWEWLAWPSGTPPTITARSSSTCA